MNIVIFLFFLVSKGIMYDFSEIGGVSMNIKYANHNSNILSVQLNSLKPNDQFMIPNKTYYLMGGIRVHNINSISFINKGTLIFSNDIKNWPKSPEGYPKECIYFSDINNITFSGGGIFDGNGQDWWGLSGYLKYEEHRPRLFHINHAKNIIIENLHFTNSPYWTVHLEDIYNLVVRYVKITNYIKSNVKHNLQDLTAFNTDGIDVTGDKVHMHDLYIWTQDDCIAVKGDSTNMLFERINASGLGLTIGSIGNNIVNNITFRNSKMYNTIKGIYLKFNGDANNLPGGSITNILYENITIIEPIQYPIWIGPAQQADTINICAANPCSLCWPYLKPFAKCNLPKYGNYTNITLKNINIKSSKRTHIFLMGSSEHNIKNLTLHNVNSNVKLSYYCENIDEIHVINSSYDGCILTQDIVDNEFNITIVSFVVSFLISFSFTFALTYYYLNTT